MLNYSLKSVIELFFFLKSLNVCIILQAFKQFNIKLFSFSNFSPHFKHLFCLTIIDFPQ